MSSDENLTDDLVENQKNVSCEETSDTDCESESKKRKNTWTDEAKNTKYFKKSDGEIIF